MSAPNPEPSPMHPWGDSDSSDTMIVEWSGPADLTPQPATGKLLEVLRAEKEKLERYRQGKAGRDQGSQAAPKLQR